MEGNPDTGIPLYLQLIILFAIILINAYFSMAESALINANRTKLKALEEEGESRAAKVLKFTENQNRLINTIQTILTFLTVFASAFVIYNMQGMLSSLIREKGCTHSEFFSVLILIVLLAFLILWLGDWFPRKVARQHAESIAMGTVSFISFMAVILKPFVWFNSKFVNLLLRICRQKVNPEEEEFSEEEVMSMLETGPESGALKEEGMKMIDSIFAFDDKLAYEIMTPRTDVFAIDINDHPDEYMDMLMSLKFSRIPVYEDDIDNIKGILYIKDYLIQAYRDGFDNVNIRDILREPYFVPETKNIDSLFYELQKSKQHIAVLIDEYGGFAGIATMEDIIEEVMGDIDDEYDDEEIEIVKLDENTYMVSGNMDLDDVNEETGSDLSSENSETMGGFIMEMLGEIPDEDERHMPVLEFENYRFEVVSVKDRRIEKVRFHIEEETEEDKEKEKSNGEKNDSL